MKKQLLQIGMGLIIVAIFALHVSGKFEIGVVNTLENLAYDTRVKLTTKKEKDNRIVIVDVDERTLREMGQWPWPRENIKKLIDRLFDQYEISVLGFDVVFAEPDSKSGSQKLRQIAQSTNDKKLKIQLEDIAERINGDILLSESLVGRNVVLGYYFNTDGEEENSVGALPEPAFEDDGFMNMTFFPVDAVNFNGNLSMLQDSALTGGFFSNPLIDNDGIIRRIPLLHEYQGALFDSLPVAVAKTHLNEIVSPIFGDAEIEEGIPLMSGISIGDREIAMDTRGGVMIPYRGKSGSFPYVSATDVVNGKVENPEILKNAIVLVGTTAIGLADLKATPVQGVYPGVEAHANIVSGILDQTFKTSSPFAWAIELAIIVGLGLILVFVLPFLAPLWSSIVFAGVLIGVIGVNFHMWQNQHSIVPIAATLGTVVMLYIVNTIYGLFAGRRHIKEVRKSFSSYLAPALVEQLVNDPASLNMEGENRNMTFLFTDIAGFTTFTEQTEAKLLVKTLNEYLDQACQLIMEHGGTIDKMIGDAIVAIFNAPVTLDQHPQRAVQAALALDIFCNEFSERKQAEGIGMGITRIGINTGNAVVGNFGGLSRFDYTVIGDSVNTAARMESVNKHLGTRMCISGSTVAECPDLFFRPVATLVLKGKTEGVEAFEPLSEEDYHSKQMQDYRELYEMMTSEDKEAEKRVQQLAMQYPDDPVYQLHQKRFEDGNKGVLIVMDEK